MSAPFGTLDSLTVVAAIAALLLAVGVVGTILTEVQLAKRQRHLGTGERTRTPSGHVAMRKPPANAGGLSAEELARLNAFRATARYMAGESLEPVTWWRKVRHAWRDGYAGWIVASLVGAFSMATHFGAYWLISGGGWLGAAAVTLLSTAAMVGVCAWIGLGLIATPRG